MVSGFDTARNTRYTSSLNETTPISFHRAVSGSRCLYPETNVPREDTFSDEAEASDSAVQFPRRDDLNRDSGFAYRKVGPHRRTVDPSAVSPSTELCQDSV